MTPLREGGPQQPCVLDDAVVSESKRPATVDVGMGVREVGRAVRRPPRVSDADMSGGLGGPQGTLEPVDLPDSLVNVDAPLNNQRHPGGVVTPVFQPP